MHLEIANPLSAQQHVSLLSTLLIDSVNSGASVGWIPPLAVTEAERYWQSRIPEIAAGSRILVLAWDAASIIGAAQLGLEQRENGLHRAEVQKVMVHTDYRRRGVGRQLMRALEDAAREHQRTLLFLDTREGDTAETLYQAVGFVKVGTIPQYATNANGHFEGTVFYYKLLS